MRFLIDHTSLAFGIPEAIALVFMLVIVVMVWKKSKKLKEAQKELEEKVAGLNAAETVPVGEDAPKKEPPVIKED